MKHLFTGGLSNLQLHVLGQNLENRRRNFPFLGAEAAVGEHGPDAVGSFDPILYGWIQRQAFDALRREYRDAGRRELRRIVTLDGNIHRDGHGSDLRLISPHHRLPDYGTPFKPL